MKVVVFVSAMLLINTLGASAQAQAPCDLNGDWRCTDVCRDGFAGKTARIGQDGNRLNFINEWGNATTGSVVEGRTIRANGWNLGGIVSPSCRRIQWDNGTTWDR